MKRRCMAAAIVASSLIVACNKMPAYQVRTLRSGKAVKVMGIGQINFSKAPPALMLNYLTDLNVQDRVALRKEADEIWEEFRPEVEKAGLSGAILSANSFNQASFRRVRATTLCSSEILQAIGSAWTT